MGDPVYDWPAWTKENYPDLYGQVYPEYTIGPTGMYFPELREKYGPWPYRGEVNRPKIEASWYIWQWYQDQQAQEVQEEEDIQEEAGHPGADYGSLWVAYTGWVADAQKEYFDFWHKERARLGASGIEPGSFEWERALAYPEKSYEETLEDYKSGPTYENLQLHYQQKYTDIYTGEDTTSMHDWYAGEFHAGIRDFDLEDRPPWWESDEVMWWEGKPGQPGQPGGPVEMRPPGPVHS